MADRNGRFLTQPWNSSSGESLAGHKCVGLIARYRRIAIRTSVDGPPYNGTQFLLHVAHFGKYITKLPFQQTHLWGKFKSLYFYLSWLLWIWIQVLISTVWNVKNFSQVHLWVVLSLSLCWSLPLQMSPNHSDKMSQKSQVPLYWYCCCMEQSHLLSCFGQLTVSNQMKPRE